MKGFWVGVLFIGALFTSCVSTPKVNNTDNLSFLGEGDHSQEIKKVSYSPSARLVMGYEEKAQYKNNKKIDIDDGEIKTLDSLDDKNDGLAKTTSDGDIKTFDGDEDDATPIASSTNPQVADSDSENIENTDKAGDITPLNLNGEIESAGEENNNIESGIATNNAEQSEDSLTNSEEMTQGEQSLLPQTLDADGDLALTQNEDASATQEQNDLQNNLLEIDDDSEGAFDIRQDETPLADNLSNDDFSDDLTTGEISDSSEDKRNLLGSVTEPEVAVNIVEEDKSTDWEDEGTKEERPIKDEVDWSNSLALAPSVESKNEDTPLVEDLSKAESRGDLLALEVESEDSRSVLDENLSNLSSDETEATPPAEKENDSGLNLSAPLPSRTMDLSSHQMVEVTYPGRDWKYLESIDGEGKGDFGISRFELVARKTGLESTTFLLKARVSDGVYLLHFYDTDILTGEFIDDFLEVKVFDSSLGGVALAPSYYSADYTAADANIALASDSEENENSEESLDTAVKNNSLDTNSIVAADTVKEPSNKTSKNSSINIDKDLSYNDRKSSPAAPKVDSAPKKQDNVAMIDDFSESYLGNEAPFNNIDNNIDNADDRGDDVASESSGIVSSESEDEMLLDAQTLFEEGKWDECLTAVKKFLLVATDRADEGLFLEGRLLEEAENDMRDERQAIKSYEKLVKRFPMSELYEKARRRIIYLQRFFIDIR